MIFAMLMTRSLAGSLNRTQGCGDLRCSEQASLFQALADLMIHERSGELNERSPFLYLKPNFNEQFQIGAHGACPQALRRKTAPSYPTWPLKVQRRF
jgi:hypothetical protein